MTHQLLAIDPGKQGGMAWVDADNVVRCLPMPKTEGDVLQLLYSLSAVGTRRCVIEHVVGFIPGSGAGAMFTFGEGFGFLKGCLMALKYEIVLVRPPKWQQALSLGTKATYGKQWKNHLKERAQQLYPHCEVTLSTADALLLLEYGRRM